MQASFQYDPTEASLDAAGLPFVVSIFADRSHVREHLRGDALAAGLRPGLVGELSLMLDSRAHALGDVVMVDCPVISGEILAALTRLDARANRVGAQMVVSTSVESLDVVFACCDQSDPEILVDPTRGERVVALGQLLTQMPDMRLRDITDADRVSLLRLTEQVAQIAERLERLDARGTSADGGAFRFGSFNREFHGANDECQKHLPKPPLPDPRLVRGIIRHRQARARFFDDELFADPAWDILLDLTAARAEHKRVSVTSLCIAAGVPPTTALRWIKQMVEAGLLERVEDEADKRRAFIALTDSTADAMARYFVAIREGAAELV